MSESYNKLAHVLNAPQTRKHTCHWPECKEQVPPAMWGCKRHWFKLPSAIRAEIWRTYRAGQEEDLNVSREYLTAANKAQDWIRKNVR